MPYLLHVHGIPIEASTAEDALALAELYAARQGKQRKETVVRGGRESAGNAVVAPVPQPREPKPKAQPALLTRLQPMQIDALKAIAAGGKDGLTDEELCAALDIQRATLGGVLSAITKHAKAMDIKFEGELIAKDPITTESGKRAHRYIPLHGLTALLRGFKSE